MQLLITVCHVDLSPGATKMSYTREGQATDSIIMTRLKKKLGNTGYQQGRKDARLSASPRTPVGKN